MNIVIQPLRKNGCTFYRLLQPYGALKKRGHDVLFMDKSGDGMKMAQAVENADIIVARDGGEALVEFVTENFPDKTVIYDMDDDLWDINPFSPAYRDYGTEEVEWNGQMLWEDGVGNFDIERNKQKADYRISVIEKCDFVTVTTDRLKERINEHVDAEIKILPNAVDFDIWWDLPLESADNIRMGWSGGASHYIDWHSIKDALPEVMEDAELVLSGHKWEGTLGGVEYEFHEWTDVEAHPYRQAALNIDIGLLPLADNDFNKSKSCIKWYEFAALGIPCVAANVAPYSDEIQHGVTGFLYDNDEEFIEYVNMLKYDEEMRDEMGQASKEWVRDNRSKEVVADIHEKLI